MLFNSYLFILLFLPLTLLGFSFAGHFGRRWSEAFLVVASFVFYASWSFGYGILIVAQLVFNFLVGRAIGRIKQADRRKAKMLTALAVFANICLLAYFKYTNFVLGNLYELVGQSFTALHIILPLAISFHTFQQVSYLVDEYKEDVPTYSFVEYCLFVLFFPQLIAGPIVRHRELIGELRRMPLRLRAENVAEGICFFVVGLAKKVLLADQLSLIADPVFSNLGSHPPDLLLGLVATLSFGLGLYFDFSGYSDMAIGISRLFGVRLPYNFNSPYRSLSIIDFWRRWHITLSLWLRDYLYIPLGGSRTGALARQRNLMTTMVLGGLWHGASWNFVIWGALHGAFLAINHGWRAAAVKAGWNLPRPLAWLATFAAVMIAWIFFKAVNFHDALTMLRGLTGYYGVLLEETRTFLTLPSDALVFGTYGWFREWARLIYYEGSHFPVLGAALLIALLPLNTQHLIDGAEGKSVIGGFSAGILQRIGGVQSYVAKPTPALGAALALLVLLAMTRLSEVKQFVYFQF